MNLDAQHPRHRRRARRTRRGPVRTRGRPVQLEISGNDLMAVRQAGAERTGDL